MFRPRTARADNGALFVSFQLAISKDALNKISREVRSWRLHRRIGSIFAQLAKAINPIVNGWMRYHGASPIRPSPRPRAAPSRHLSAGDASPVRRWG
ncbi:group II intron maturase-specific domain-containing protein [Streptosporangium sp. NPDC001681]|uniref:group II intron maturase-specific domain-containing protein n=1 Tax=Streptosporangium sp. NPDC001681 TaxID=3154395 RepID=UPI0033234A96